MTPAVFIVSNMYQIMLPVEYEATMWVKVGDKVYYDDCNGILRSNTNMHKVELPMSVLDEAKEYTVVYRKMIERLPYFPTSEDERSYTVSFRPVKDGGDINIYHISDAHNLVEEPVAAGRYFGDEIDLLVLNGDIPNHSGDIKNFNAICEIAAGVTGGTAGSGELAGSAGGLSAALQSGCAGDRGGSLPVHRLCLHPVQKRDRRDHQPIHLQLPRGAGH